MGHKIKSWGIRANDQKWCERSALEVVVQPLTTDTIAVAVGGALFWSSKRKAVKNDAKKRGAGVRLGCC